MHFRESSRWSCKKHSSVSQSITESVIISLDAGFGSDDEQVEDDGKETYCVKSFDRRSTRPSFWPIRSLGTVMRSLSTRIRCSTPMRVSSASLERSLTFQLRKETVEVAKHFPQVQNCTVEQRRTGRVWEKAAHQFGERAAVQVCRSKARRLGVGEWRRSSMWDITSARARSYVHSSRASTATHCRAICPRGGSHSKGAGTGLHSGGILLTCQFHRFERKLER